MDLESVIKHYYINKTVRRHKVHLLLKYFAPPPLAIPGHAPDPTIPPYPGKYINIPLPQSQYSPVNFERFP